MVNYKECVEESEHDGKKLLITFYGEIKIEDINQIRDLLLESFRIQDQVVLDVADVTVSDFTFYQILCSTNKYAQSNDKKFELKNHLQPVFREQTQSLGFLRQHGCAEAKNPTRCLWLDQNIINT